VNFYLLHSAKNLTKLHSSFRNSALSRRQLHSSTVSQLQRSCLREFAESDVRPTRDFGWANSVAKFIVSGMEEAYDAHTNCLNANFG
jgi:hypothetical protein